MSRVGQFLGKLFGGKNETLLRAYGKLPFYAEYRRLEVSPGAATVFSQWLDEGRLAWVRSRPEKGRGSMRTSHVLLRWPDCREWIVATIWDSRDSLGRIFPFAFFITCPPEWLGDDRLQRWVSCSAIHAHFTELHGRLAALGSGGDFYRLYRKYVLPTRLDDLPQQVQQLRAQADAIDLETWLSAAGLGDLPPGDWLAGTHTRAARWKVQPASASQLALNCPLASGSGYVVQAVLWLQWISTLGLAADKEPAIVLPAPGTPGPARMQIVFRDLLPDDFQLLTTDAGAYGYIEDLGQAPAAATPGTAAAGAASSGSLLAALTAPQDT